MKLHEWHSSSWNENKLTTQQFLFLFFRNDNPFALTAPLSVIDLMNPSTLGLLQDYNIDVRVLLKLLAYCVLARKQQLFGPYSDPFSYCSLNVATIILKLNKETVQGQKYLKSQTLYLTDSMLWGTRWPQRRAMWRHRPWQRQTASSASWDPPVWWRCRSGSGKSPACYRAARYSDHSSPRSAVSYGVPGLQERQGDRSQVK